MQFSFNRHLRFFRSPSSHSLLCFRDEWSDGSSNYNIFVFFLLKTFHSFLLASVLARLLSSESFQFAFYFFSSWKKGNLFTEKIAEFCSREFSSSLHHFSLFAMIQTLRYLLSKRGRDWREGGREAWRPKPGHDIWECNRRTSSKVSWCGSATAAQSGWIAVKEII